MPSDDHAEIWLEPKVDGYGSEGRFWNQYNVWDEEDNAVRYVRADLFEQQAARIAALEDEAATYLRSFLVSFTREHFPENTAWRPLPDLLGMLTQMDNASTIARDYKARIAALEGALHMLLNGGFIGMIDRDQHREIQRIRALLGGSNAE